MKKITWLLFSFLLISALSFSQSREKFNFNSDWKLKVFDDAKAAEINYDDGDWNPVTLPHAWNESDAFWFL
ncbi:MAG: hypothetical protein ABIP95_06975 [Pelobium sp.]